MQVKPVFRLRGLERLFYLLVHLFCL
jgi:hypothetical protein